MMKKPHRNSYEGQDNIMKGDSAHLWMDTRYFMLISGE